MSYLVKDVVCANSNAEFRNDVQLASYRSNQNLDLLNGYIFTRKAAPGKESSIDLLRYLCDSFLPGRSPNRFVFMATYGHGKSHFSLALANFFGKKVSSPETSSVLSKIKHAANDDALYGYFESFKKNHKPFLVLIMSGRDQRDLPTQFYSSIEESLNDDGLCEEIELPFWYAGALEFLEKIPGSLSPSVENFLSTQGYELGLLIERVKNHDSSTYDICHNLFTHLYSVPPKFGAVQGLKQSLEWLASNLCGNENPYSGVLILFDEFSAFVRDYGLTMGTRPGTPLQDLLDGVENCREKISFAALSQHDPETVAETTLKRASTEDLQSLKIQLNRLPVAQRYQLHSSLEEVLDAYLRQDFDVWASVLKDSSFETALYDSNDIAYEAFSKRYSDVLNWNGEHFQEVVTKGCYPLHPMTTALLCTVDLQETANPRSVLGFVLKSLNQLSDKPVVNNGVPSWLLPTSLVDYFSEMLGSEVWDNFLDAKTQAGGPDAELEEIDVLKAMVLQIAAQVPTRQIGYSKIIGQFSGLSRDKATSTLQELSGSGVIRHDPVKNIYTFWPAGKGANKVEEILAKKLKKINSLTPHLINKIENQLKEATLLNAVPITVSWGHQDDWKVENFIATRELFNRDWLVKLVNAHLIHRLDGADRCRGVIIWLLADSEDCADWYRENVSKVLKEAFDDQTIPLVVKRPRNPNPDLISLIRRSYGLSEFSNMEISDSGREQFETVHSQNMTSIKESIGIFFRDTETEVLPAFSAQIKAVMPPNLELLFKEIFSMSYPNGPKRWFTQYKISQTSLKSATKVLVGLLLANSLNSAQALSNNKVAKEAVDLFLQPEWKIVGADLRLCQPNKGAKAYPAWEFLDNEFENKRKPVLLKKIFKRLLISPYGYDITTAMILFAAWLGYRRYDVVISKSGRIISVEDIPGDIKSFVKQIGDYSIKINDPNEIKKEINTILKEISKGSISKKQAKAYIITLEKYIDRADVEDPETVESALSKLRTGYSSAKNYDEQVDEISKNTSISNTSTDNLLSALGVVKNFSIYKTVCPDNDGISVIRNEIFSKIRVKVKAEILKTEEIGDISQYSLHLNSLEMLLEGLKRYDITDLVTLVEAAIKTLKKNKIILENISKDREAIGYVNGLSINGKIIDLNKNLKELNELDVVSEKGIAVKAEKEKFINREISSLVNKAKSFSGIIRSAKNTGELKEVETKIHQTQPIFVGVKEIRILDEALAECRERTSDLEQSERNNRKAEEKDAPIVAVMDQFSVQSQRLSALRKHLTRLSKYSFHNDSSKQKSKEQIIEINKEITKLMQFFDKSIEQSLLLNEEEATTLRTKILENISRFEGTEESEQLLNVRTICDKCLLFFKDISFVKHVKTQSPEEIYEIIDNLKKIKSKYNIFLGKISDLVISDIVNDLHKKISYNEECAVDWLINLKGWSEKKLSPRKVIAELEQPHNFLPSSAFADLELLKVNVRSTLDSDQLFQIIELFKGISNKDKREACISKLNELNNDDMST